MRPRLIAEPMFWFALAAGFYLATITVHSCRRSEHVYRYSVPVVNLGPEPEHHFDGPIPTFTKGAWPKKFPEIGYHYDFITRKLSSTTDPAQMNVPKMPELKF